MFKDNSEITILIVDDDLAMRLLMRESLAPAGYKIEEAENGELALKAFKKHRPDIILMDVQMPVMDGFTACKKLRQSDIGADVPVLIITGLEDVASIEKAYQIGATDFITKPIDWLILSQRVRYMLKANNAFQVLRKQEASLLLAQRIAKLGNWEWNTKNHRLLCSDVLLDIAGMPPLNHEVDYLSIKQRIHADDFRSVIRSLSHCLSNQEPVDFEFRGLGQRDETRLFHCLGEYSKSSGNLVGTLQDITDQRAAEEKIHRLAYYDPLTNLPNQRMFTEHIERTMVTAKNHRFSIGLLLIDLDRFSRFNDSLGRGCGDTVLTKVAATILEGLRGTDMLTASKHDALPETARLGGDEFLVIVPNIKDAESLARIASRLSKAISEPFKIDNQEIFVTASIGIAVYPGDGADPETLIKHATIAVQHAKEAGRSTYRFYTDSLNTRSLALLNLETQLRIAITSDQLRLFYQPKVNLATGKVTGLEALLRWQHPELGLVPPVQFIQLAEESGLIVPIGKWVLHQACKMNRAWHDAGIDTGHMAVNISGIQFRREDLSETIDSALEESGLPSHLLELEVTESCIMQDMEVTQSLLTQYREKGVKVSVDDFGTGYSSMTYLKYLPIDTLKIDGAFVRDLENGQQDKAIIKAITALCEGLNLNVVAECVETLGQAAILRELGCKEIQGYLISPPVEAELIPDLVQNAPALLFRQPEKAKKSAR